MIQRTSAPIGYGSAFCVAGPNGNPLCRPRQIINGQAAKLSTASPKKTQARMPIQPFEHGPRFNRSKEKPRGEAGPRHQTRVETLVVYLNLLFSPIFSSRLYFTPGASVYAGSTLPEFAFPGDTLIPVVVFDFISRLPSSFGHKGDDRVPLAQSTNRFLTWIVMDNGANLIFVCHHSPSQSRGLQERATGAALLCRAALTWPPLSRERPLDGADAAAAHTIRTRSVRVAHHPLERCE